MVAILLKAWIMNKFIWPLVQRFASHPAIIKADMLRFGHTSQIRLQAGQVVELMIVYAQGSMFILKMVGLLDGIICEKYLSHLT